MHQDRKGMGVRILVMLVSLSYVDCAAEAVESSTSGFSVSSDDAAGEFAKSTLDFGSFENARLARPLYLNVVEEDDGTATVALVYSAVVRETAFSLNLVAGQLAQDAWSFEQPAVHTLGVWEDGRAQKSKAGTIIVARPAPGSVVTVEFRSVQMIDTRTGADAPDGLMDGTLTAQLEYGCEFLGPHPAGITVTELGKSEPLRMWTSDPTWSSAFCSQHRPAGWDRAK